MSRVLTIPIENVSIGTAVQDIFAAYSGSAHGIILHQIHLEAVSTGQSSLRMRLKRYATGSLANGSGGTNVTPSPTSQNNNASVLGTYHINDTTQATATTFSTLAGFQWDIALPFDHLPAPEDREDCKASSALILDLPATITAVTVSGYMKVEEVP